ncbi:hypothetical protein DASC09_010760 [Saccharomycopsis crataegensis]|uniref:Uncharacterized protein n=1 Tax=Saccharomycopsis crataegensis TaxID=43959 RepID=A0AAV5QGM5_9ASCO|nr:hypothetical protein DASC09_010760 [Saccharomycopsis crataegensis]
MSHRLHSPRSASSSSRRHQISSPTASTYYSPSESFSHHSSNTQPPDRSHYRQPSYDQYDGGITNQQLSIERKFHNYDYQDISDFKVKSSKSAKLRASIGVCAATIKSSRSAKSSKSVAKVQRESASRPLSSGGSYSANSSVNIDSMSISMHSVAISSVHQKHIHVGPAESTSGAQTNYDKQKVRMYLEKKALSSDSQTAFDLVSLDSDRSGPYQQSPTCHGSNRKARPRGSNASSKRKYSSSQPVNRQSHRSRSSQEYIDDNQVFLISKDSCIPLNDDQHSLLDDISLHQPPPRSSSHPKINLTNNNNNNNSTGSTDSAGSSNSRNSYNYYNSSSPLTSPENSPLTNPKQSVFQQFDGHHANPNSMQNSPQLSNLSTNQTLDNKTYQPSSIVKAAIPKEGHLSKHHHRNHQNPHATFVPQYKQIPEETASMGKSLRSRKHSHHSLGSKMAPTNAHHRHNSNNETLNNSHGNGITGQNVETRLPKTVFSLEDTLRADKDLSLPTHEELKRSVATNLHRKPTPTQTPNMSMSDGKVKRKSGGFFGFLANLFGGNKNKKIDKRKIEVVNQRIGVY